VCDECRLADLGLHIQGLIALDLGRIARNALLKANGAHLGMGTPSSASRRRFPIRTRMTCSSPSQGLSLKKPAGSLWNLSNGPLRPRNPASQHCGP
jgi:hypothetical protein